MSDSRELELMLSKQIETSTSDPKNPSDSPFQLVVDPEMRFRIKKALFELIDSHDKSLAKYVADGNLQLESYKEYIELFARCLRETMESQEGIFYLLKSAGFDIKPEDINVYPEWRWKTIPEEMNS
ncbi:MAG: hypothetical protein AAF984_10060 [Verrucomicrobiota bacterium]